jgi:hypothetical protein
MNFAKPIALLSLASALLAPQFSSAQTYTIHYRPAPGNHSYSMALRVQSAGAIGGGPAQSFNMAMTGRVLMAVKKLSGDQFSTTTTFGNVAMSINGKSAPAQSLDAMNKLSMTMVMDSNGKLISSTGTGAAGNMSSMMGDLSKMGLYGKPLHVGQTIKNSAAVMGTNMSSSFKFVKVRQSGGRKIAVLEMQSLNTGAAASVSFVGHPTMEVDLGTGMPVAIKMTMLASANGAKSKTMMDMHELH